MNSHLCEYSYKFLPAFFYATAIIFLSIPAICGQTPQPTPLFLPIDQKTEYSLTSKRPYPFAKELRQNEVLRIDLQEKGVDCKIVLVETWGDKNIVAQSNFGSGYERETLTYIVQKPGLYVIGVGRLDDRNGKFDLYAQVKPSPSASDYKQIKAEGLLSQAAVLQSKGDRASLLQAIAAWKESRSIWRELKDEYWEGYSLNWLGLASTKLGQLKTSLSYYDQALQLFRDIDDVSNESTVLINIGASYSRLGENKKVVEYCEKALPIKTGLGDDNSKAMIFTNLGLAYSELGEKQKALQYFDQALALFESTEDESGKAVVFGAVGGIYSSIGRKQNALEVYNKALDFFVANHSQSEEATTRNNIGLVYSDMGEKQKAFENYLQALKIFISTGEQIEEATTRSNLGELYLDLGENKKALEYYDQALQLATQNDDQNTRASTLTGIAGVYGAWGDNKKALQYYNQALALFIAMDIKDGEASSLNNIGSVYSILGEKQKALEYYNRSLFIAKDIGDKTGEAKTLNNIGMIYSDLGEKYKALENLELALSLFNKLLDKAGEGSALSNLGLVYSDLGEKQKALKYYNLALPLRESASDVNGQAETLVGTGLVYFDLGVIQKAQEYFNQGLLLYQKTGDKTGEATTYNNIGLVYSDLGDKQNALENYEEALKLFRQIGNKSSQAAALSNIGLIYSDLEEKQKAFIYYNRALPLRKLVGDKTGEATTLNNIGLLYSGSKNTLTALRYFRQALALFLSVKNPSGEASSMTNIGSAYSSLKSHQKALEYYEQALPLFKFAGNKRNEAMTLNNLMVELSDLNNVGLAVFYGKQMIRKYQELRKALLTQDREVQKEYLKTIDFTYRALAEILITQGRLKEALQVIDAYRDQEFYDKRARPESAASEIISTTQEKEANRKYDAAVEEIGRIGQSLEELRRKLVDRIPTAEETTQKRALESQMTQATSEFVLVLKQIQAEFSKPELNNSIGREPDALPMQIALSALDGDTKQNSVAVYTFLGENMFYLLLITKDDIKYFSKPIAREELNKKAKEFADDIKATDSVTHQPKFDVKKQAQELYDIIFKPIEPYLPRNNATIMWNLDGNLRYVPLNALHDGKDYLVRRNINNTVFTRSETERLTRSLKPVWTGAGFASSKKQKIDYLDYEFYELVAAEAEMTGIFNTPNSKKGILDGEILLNDDFTKENMFLLLKKEYPVVHISSHFKIQPGDLARSVLVLGKGVLSLFDLKTEAKSFKDGKVFNGVDLLTLSACNTALDEPNSNGREVDGFAELAQSLGAASVLATLWEVNECSTAEFMKLFYRNKVLRKMTKAEAIRQTQLDLLDGKVNSSNDPCSVKSDGGNTALNPLKPRSIRIHTAFTYDPSKPFEHPYYWSPFVLYGNWK